MLLVHMLAEQVVLEAAGEKLSRSLIKEIEQRKSLHFNIKASAHRALRIACFQRKLSMQEVPHRRIDAKRIHSFSPPPSRAVAM